MVILEISHKIWLFDNLSLTRSEGDESLIVFIYCEYDILIRWMKYFRVKYSIIGTYFWFYFVCSPVMKKNILLCDKIEYLQKRKGMQSDEKDNGQYIDPDAVHSNYYLTILVLELRKPATPPSLGFLGFTAKFLCLFSFPFLVGIVMDGTKHIMGGEKKVGFPPEIIWWNLFFLLLGGRGSLWRISCHQDTSLNDVVDRIYILGFTVSVLGSFS